MKIISVGIDDSADVKIADYKVDTTGSRIVLIINGKEWSLESKLLGKPNVYNIALSVAACHAFKIKKSHILEGIHDVESIEGRLQRLDAGQDFAVFVDYAHSPDALMNVLLAVREITKNRVITVFGCGGDRDRTKRPMMGQHATVLSDICIITTDNPRSEDPKKIIDDILDGVKQVDSSEKCYVIEDRREAIAKAISIAQKGDTVLIAGKGHEDYQILGENVIHFDDRQEALNFLRRRLEFGD
jgi:UDP-N-acetylmuramoyl-L-alanyl-D-glutamate--2,6-diaminopimelate ligase